MATLDGDALSLVLAVLPLADRCQALRTARSWAAVSSNGTAWARNVFEARFAQNVCDADVVRVILRAGVHLVHLEIEVIVDDCFLWSHLTPQALVPLVRCTALTTLILRDCPRFTCEEILRAVPPGLKLHALSVGGCDIRNQTEILALRELVAPDFRPAADDPLSGLNADLCSSCEIVQDDCVVCSADGCESLFCGARCTWATCRGRLRPTHAAFKCDRCFERFCLNCKSWEHCDRCMTITCDDCKPDGFTAPGSITCARCREAWCGTCSTDEFGMLDFVWTARGHICPDCAESCKENPDEEDPWDGHNDDDDEEEES